MQKIMLWTFRERNNCMQFNSYVYSLCFLPIVTGVYYFLNKFGDIIGKIFLLVASVIFYTNFDITVLNIIVISLLINLLFANIIETSDNVNLKKTLRILPVAINVSLLLYFKYSDFAIANVNSLLDKDYQLKNLFLPIGISFFTFQQIAYIVAVYKKEIQKVDILDYLVYILYFPKILMGPLAEPVDFIKQLNDTERKRVNWDNIVQGIQIFGFGLFKKLMIADVFAKAVSWGYRNES